MLGLDYWPEAASPGNCKLCLSWNFENHSKLWCGSQLSQWEAKRFFFFSGGERMECWSNVKYTELSVWVYRDLIHWYEWLTLPSTCHCMYIESSQLLISSDVGAIIVPIVSLKEMEAQERWGNDLGPSASSVTEPRSNTRQLRSCSLLLSLGRCWLMYWLVCF